MSDLSASASTLAIVPTAPKQATLLQCMLVRLCILIALRPPTSPTAD